MKLCGIAVVLGFLVHYCTSAVDRTLEDNASGAEVVRSVLSRLEQANLYDSISISSQKMQVYELFMREMSFVESEDGLMNTANTQGGIWRLNETIFGLTRSLNYNNLYQLICDVFCIDWRSVSYRDLTKPLYSGLAVQIYIYHLEITGAGLPESATDRLKADFWIQQFLSNQQSSEKWLTRVFTLRETEECRINTDVVFVLDSSGSVGPENFQLVRDYVRNYTENLLDGTGNNRVGIILYSSDAQVEVSLDFLSNNSTSDLLNRIQAIPYLRRNTNTPEGLCLLQTLNWRNSISTLRSAVVLTDGQSNRESRNCGNGTNTLQTTAQEIHNRIPQIVVTAVGVAGFVPSELRLIATSNETVDEIREFDPNLLEQNQYYRAYSACFKAVQTVSNNNNVTEGTADQGSVSRLQFSGSSSEGVSIKICVEFGGIVIYGSYSNPNPGPALHDYTEELSATRSLCFTSYADITTVTESSTCSSCTTTTGNREQRLAANTDINVYVTITGSVNNTRFTVENENGRGLLENLQTGCRGESGLCASGATAICTMNTNTSGLLCECANVAGLENLPACEEIQSTTTEDQGTRSGGVIIGAGISIPVLCVVAMVTVMAIAGVL